ncbi:MAG: aspartate aminotransferase family protein [SAR86 cluster bacterium]|uniref:Aspartate aminotransferase family protein n=1 Tax=SAR86 cluster bacterium TaxID=2030880 RepID=A0A2A4X6I1_9GAMM|nr:MAG: aspartate aminotransferase family protein [SAR86 cluster bacterium]
MSSIEIEDRLGITFCNRQSIAIERGEGCLVWDENGNEYLDFTSGWGVTCLGHSHPLITDALIKQAQKIIQNPNSGFTYSPSRAKLLETLSGVLPGNLAKIYFANSGAEANDAAIKLARKITGKSKVVSTLASFHGRTFNTLSISGGKDNAEQFLPALEGNCFVPFGDISALNAAIDEKTAAVILEPIQGEGGVRIPDEQYFASVALLCKERGVLLIIDEIQTGFCRTGKFFAIEHSPTSIAPDILTMGKGIAGGFPFAAFAVSESVDKQLNIGDHGGTFCGNPLACAVATAVVSHLRAENIADKVAKSGELMIEGLHKLRKKYPKLIGQIRGKGLLCAFELGSDHLVTKVTEAALRRGLLVTPTRNRIIRLIPALIVTGAEIARGLELLESALASVVPRH